MRIFGDEGLAPAFIFSMSVYNIVDQMTAELAYQNAISHTAIPIADVPSRDGCRWGREKTRVFQGLPVTASVIYTQLIP